MDWSKTIYESWAEVFFVVLLIIGLLVSLLLNSAALSYIVIFLCGILAGRYFYLRRIAQPIFPFIIILIGFLLGFLLGAIHASKLVIIVLFLISTVGSYYLHKKGYLEVFKTAGFIK